MTLIAIDPGVKGGFAYRDADGALILEKMPDTQGDIFNFLSGFGPSDEIVMERVRGYIAGAHGTAAQGFTLGCNVGFMRGVCAALGIGIIEVQAAVWIKEIGLSKGNDAQPAWKKRLKEEAQRRYPLLSKRITEHTADALLILEYETTRRMERKNETGTQESGGEILPKASGARTRRKPRVTAAGPESADDGTWPPAPHGKY